MGRESKFYNSGRATSNNSEWGNIFVYITIGTNDGSVRNCNPPAYNGINANPNIILYNTIYFSKFFVPVLSFKKKMTSRNIIDIMLSGSDGYIVTDRTIITNYSFCNFAIVSYVCVHTNRCFIVNKACFINVCSTSNVMLFSHKG